MSNRMLSLCSDFGRREMLGNRVCDNVETDENFSYSQANHSPNGSFKV